MKKINIETQMEDVTMQAGGLLRSRYGLWILAGISFIESALIVPLITDPFLVAYILADKKSVYKGVVVTFLASIVGGIFAYAIAFSFYEFIVAQYLVGSLGEQFDEIIQTFQKGVFIITLSGAITPIPYTLVALGAGFIKGNFFLFLLASLLGRGLRYGIVGFVTYKFGEQALQIVKKRILLISILLIMATLVYFLVL